jgi:hypothetical protein
VLKVEGRGLRSALQLCVRLIFFIDAATEPIKGKGEPKMKTKISLSIVLMLSLTLAVGPSTSVAQTNPTFLQLGQAKGALYKPDSGPRASRWNNRDAP